MFIGVFILNTLTAVMLLVINIYFFFSTYIFYFEYMKGDPHINTIYGISFLIILFLC